MKFFYFLVITLFCLVLGLAPDAVLWAVYKGVHPATELGRVLTMCTLIFFGGSACIGFFVVAAILWTAGVTSVARE